MNPMLQRHCAKFIYIVPDGLRELMSDISREVIRTQPEQVYTFIADYLDALMITRENARIAARLVDNICEIAETTVELLIRIGMTRVEADAVVSIIQDAFRGYLETKKQYHHPREIPGETEEEDFTHKILTRINISGEMVEEAAKIIQGAWRKFKERQEREKQMLFGMVDWRIAARSAIMLYRKTGVTMYEANRAATLIKAAYKGYYTRRIMKRLLHMALDEETSLQIDSTISEDYDLASERGEMPDYVTLLDYGEDASVGSIDYLNLDEGPGAEQVHGAHRTPRVRHVKRVPAGRKVPKQKSAPQKREPSGTSVTKTATVAKAPTKHKTKAERDTVSKHTLSEVSIIGEDGFPRLASEVGEGGTMEPTDITEVTETVSAPPNTELGEGSEPIEGDEAATDGEPEEDAEPVITVEETEDQEEHVEEVEETHEAAEAVEPSEVEAPAESPPEPTNEEAAAEPVSETATDDENTAAAPADEADPDE